MAFCIYSKHKQCQILPMFYLHIYLDMCTLSSCMWHWIKQKNVDTCDPLGTVIINDKITSLK